MSLLPSFMATEISENTAAAQVLAVPREYGIDFETGQLTGEIVEGIEAVKVWIWCCLKTPRFRFPIYSWQYGTEFEQYIGQVLTDEYLNADVLTELEDALFVNPYISAVENFEVARNGDLLHITCTVITSFGSLEVEEDV